MEKKILSAISVIIIFLIVFFSISLLQKNINKPYIETGSSESITNPDKTNSENQNENDYPYIEELNTRNSTLTELNWDQSVNNLYNRNDYSIPYVDNESPVVGENWFPPVNNTALIEDIAPEISYDMALSLYLRFPIYPDDPEQYTAQWLNQNCFPINFMRKYNDQLYYTVCKVQNGGNLYLFFCAANYLNISDIELANQGIMLYNSDSFDISDKDMTKELVWRGCSYDADGFDNNKDIANIILNTNKSLNDLAQKYLDIEFIVDALDYQLSTRFENNILIEEKMKKLNFEQDSNSFNIFVFPIIGHDNGSLIQLKVSCEISENNYIWVKKGVNYGGFLVTADGDYVITENISWPCLILDLDRRAQ